MTETHCRQILERINSKDSVKMFLDTDTANEIDDQFAIAYAMLADGIDLLGIGAAPFAKEGIPLPESMKLSYEEILRVKSLTKKDSTVPVYPGAESYLKDVDTPVESEAAMAIAAECRKTGDMVFVPCIGCFTNAASALLMAPDIKRNMVVLLIGGLDIDRYDNGNDYNLSQDINAARVIFESGVPIILLPAAGGTEVLKLTVMECAYALEGRGCPAGDYLTGLMRKTHGVMEGVVKSATHIIWDISSVAVLRNRQGLWNPEVRDALTVDSEGTYRPWPGKMLYNTEYDRDAVFSDMFRFIVDRADRS